jgi:hypothetical protein
LNAHWLAIYDKWSWTEKQDVGCQESKQERGKEYYCEKFPGNLFHSLAGKETDDYNAMVATILPAYFVVKSYTRKILRK